MFDVRMTSIRTIEEPQVRYLAGRVLRVARLAAEKATLHNSDPNNFPMGSQKEGFALERVFLKRLRSLSLRRRQLAAQKVTAAASAPASVRNRYYGDHSKILLTHKVPVAKQSDRLAYPKSKRISAEWIRNVDTRQIAGIAQREPDLEIRAAPGKELANRLDFRINGVWCIEETDGLLGTAAGSDEIHLGGVVTDCVGNVSKVPAFKVGEFDTDDVKHYRTPRLFRAFDLLAGEGFPKAFLVVLVLAEADMGGLPQFISDLAATLAPLVADEISKAVGAGLVVVLGTLGAVIAAVLAIIVGWLIGKLVEWIREWWNDDAFVPFPQLIEIPSLAFEVEEDLLGRANFHGHGGAYQVRYSWKMHHV